MAGSAHQGALQVGPEKLALEHFSHFCCLTSDCGLELLIRESLLMISIHFQTKSEA